MKQDELDPLVKELVQKSIRPTITVTIRGIISEIKRRTGYEPSTSIVQASMKRNGISVNPGTHKWQWRHNPPKGGE